MKYSAIIFDLDGTIADTVPLWLKALSLVIQSKNNKIHPDEADNIAYNLRGLSLENTCEYVKKTLNLTDSIEKIAHEQKDIALKLYKEKINFIDGFLEFHKNIENFNLKTCIASNSDHTTITLARKRLNLEKFFGNHIYGIADVNNICKPDPTIFLYAAKKMETPPEKCMVIEDSQFGVRAAKKAGMFCIGINTGNSRDIIAEADIIVEKYEDIKLDTILKP